MSVVCVTRVGVLNNPSAFTEPFAFEVEYECSTELKHDLEWKMIYVGSADSEKYDQTLDSVFVGPVFPGNYKFTFEANAPDPSQLLQDDIVGVTVILLTCSYQEKEFIRIGYYVHNEYTDEALKEEPPAVPAINLLTRSILADHPRVTRYPADFDSEPKQEATPIESGQGLDNLPQGVERMGDGQSLGMQSMQAVS